jgi:hypothetical protein
LLTVGLPCDLDAERLVLGLILTDDSRFSEVSPLTLGDFSLERHRRILSAMRDLHESRENIDYVTVADRLRQRNDHTPDDLSFLTDLSIGIPAVPHLDSWVRILRKKASLRWAISESDKFTKECLSNSADPATILANHAANIERLREVYEVDRRDIGRVEDLESIFADRKPTDYVLKPELPVKAIITLSGKSESGKTTVASAWARDAYRKGHAVLILDRDKNPRDRICDRLARLGVDSDGKRFRIWDCEQTSEPPQPDDLIVVNWVKRMATETGKSPLVVLDALVNFFVEGEDENSAVDMRALFNRCRVLTRAGATVILIHHTNRNGSVRGSSDFDPASDQGFLVSNRDRTGGRMLDEISLKCEKSRYGFSGTITYHYASGQMHREEEGPVETQRLRDLLADNPGVLTEEFERLACKGGLKRGPVREFLKKGESDGTIRVLQEGRKRRHYRCDSVDTPD